MTSPFHRFLTSWNKDPEECRSSGEDRIEKAIINMANTSGAQEEVVCRTCGCVARNFKRLPLVQDPPPRWGILVDPLSAVYCEGCAPEAPVCAVMTIGAGIDHYVGLVKGRYVELDSWGKPLHPVTTPRRRRR